MGTEFLRELTEFGGVHPDRKRPVRCNRGAARSGAQAGEKGALRVDHLRFVDQGEAWRGALRHREVLGLGGEDEAVRSRGHYSQKQAPLRPKPKPKPKPKPRPKSAV